MSMCLPMPLSVCPSACPSLGRSVSGYVSARKSKTMTLSAYNVLGKLQSRKHTCTSAHLGLWISVCTYTLPLTGVCECMSQCAHASSQGVGVLGSGYPHTVDRPPVRQIRRRVQQHVKSTPPMPQHRVLCGNFPIANTYRAVHAVARQPLVRAVPRRCAVEENVVVEVSRTIDPGDIFGSAHHQYRS